MEPLDTTAPTKVAATAEKAVLSLNDLIGLHYKQIDITHKLWNYLWLAGAAIITVAVNYQALTIYLLAGFIPFALANARLVFLAQREAYLSSKAIKSVAKISSPPLAEEIETLIESIQPWRPEIIFIGHLVMSAFVVFALVARIL